MMTVETARVFAGFIHSEWSRQGTAPNTCQSSHHATKLNDYAPKCRSCSVTREKRSRPTFGDHPRTINTEEARHRSRP
jgi:hypothetical protein